MFKDLRTDRELGHFEGGANNFVDVPDVDLSSHIQLSAGATLHHVAGGIALLGVDRKEFVRICVHDVVQKLEKEVPAIDETVDVDAGEKACQVLVEDEGC